MITLEIHIETQLLPIDQKEGPLAVQEHTLEQQTPSLQEVEFLVSDDDAHNRPCPLTSILDPYWICQQEYFLAAIPKRKSMKC